MGRRLVWFTALGTLVLAGSTGFGIPVRLRVAPAITPIPGMVGYWPMDDVASPTTDATTSGNNGTWQNAPTFSNAGAPGLTFANPGCLALNGTNQYVDFGKPAIFPSGTNARSMCGWGKSTTTAGGYRWIFAYGTGGTSQAMFIGMNGTTLYGGGYGDDVTVANFWDTNWHHIALTYDGTTAKLYADGTLRTSAAKTWNLVPALAYIGRQVNTAAEYWNGSIDDVRLYSRVLSDNEVAVLAAGCPTPTNLTATAGTGQISLSWTAPPGPNPNYTYIVRRGTSSGTETQIASGITTTTYADTTASYGYTYYYTVTAVSAAESGPSNEAACPYYSVTSAPPALTIVEAGGIGQFTVSTLIPLANGAGLSTTATVTSGAPSAPCLLSIGAGPMSASLPISFTGNGTTTQSQTITVTGVDDFIAANPWTATITFSTTVSSDGNFSGKTIPPVTVNQIESDFPGIIVSPTSLSTTNGGPPVTFTVQLASKPTANVQLPLTVSIPYEATVAGPAGATLTFTAANWNTAQTVTVTPQSVDTTTTYVTSYEIDFTPVASADGSYNLYPLPPVPVFQPTSTPPLQKVWGGSNCGLLGAEGLLLFALLRLRRRRRS
jgi:hypothetical protein